MKKKEDGFIYAYNEKGSSYEAFTLNPGERLLPLNPFDVVIVDKINHITNERGFKFLHDSVLSQKLFGIESSFVEENPTLVREYNGDDIFFDPASEIKLFTNDKAGKVVEQNGILQIVTLSQQA